MPDHPRPDRLEPLIAMGDTEADGEGAEELVRLRGWIATARVESCERRATAGGDAEAECGAQRRGTKCGGWSEAGRSHPLKFGGALSAW